MQCHIEVEPPALPILTKAGPIRPVRSMSGDPAEAGVVEDLVHTDVVGNIFIMYFITVWAGRLSARGQDDLLSSTVSVLLSLTEIFLNVPPAVITLRLAHHHPPVVMAIFRYSG